MRILMVTADFPPAVGGMQVYSWELARAWSKWSQSVHVVAPMQADCAELDGAAPFHVTRTAYSIKDSFALSGVWPVAKAIRATKPDVIFGTSWACASGAHRAQSLTRTSIPVFAAAHGREVILRPFDHVKWLPFQRAYDNLRFDSFDRCAALFPVSRFTADLLRVRGVRNEKIDVVPNGVDPNKYYPRDAGHLRDRLRLQGKKVLLTIGRLVERKGIDTVLETLPGLVRDNPHLAYVIVGDGPDRARIEALIAEKQLGAFVHLMGRVPADEILDYYNVCDVFVMPARTDQSDVEGFGLVFFVASACGKPVVGARAGGVTDAVVENETGFLVEPHDASGLEDVLRQLLAQPLLARRMGEAGRLHVLQNGTWEQAGRAIFDGMTRRLVTKR